MNLDPEYVAKFAAWQDSFPRFVRETIPDFKATAQQLRGMEELSNLINAKMKVSRGEKLTATEEEYAKKIGLSIMAGKGPGKDTFLALCIIYFLCCFPHSKIPCTAPTGHQLRDVLWSEINKWLRQSKVKDWLTWQSDKVFFTEAEGKEWFAVARTCNPRATAEEQAETLSGFHEDFMIVGIDEASRVPDPVYRTLEGTLTGTCNLILIIFNPTRTKGFAIESHGKDRHRFVALRWNAEESENVKPAQIEFMAKKYGTDSNMYRIFVLGLPPMSGEKLLIEWDWAETAIDRDVAALPTDPVIFGIDIGAGGDASVIVVRRGPVVEKILSNDTSESEVLTGWILKYIFDYEPAMVIIDVLGPGWGIEGNIRARCRETIVIGVNVAEASSQEMRFDRLRDELCWNLRETFEKRAISIPDDPLLIGEMTSLKYNDETMNGKIKVESKRDLKKRGIESPNRFDALCYTEYYGYEMLRKMTGTKGRDNWRKKAESTWRTV